jgi:hypothetical protein
MLASPKWGLREALLSADIHHLREYGHWVFPNDTIELMYRFPRVLTPSASSQDRMLPKLEDAGD